AVEDETHGGSWRCCRSDRFHQLGRKTRSLLASLPYAESLYAFPSMVGQVFCMEQLYVSKYTISVARAMVHLVMQVWHTGCVHMQLGLQRDCDHLMHLMACA